MNKKLMLVISLSATLFAIIYFPDVLFKNVKNAKPKEALPQKAVLAQGTNAISAAEDIRLTVPPEKIIRLFLAQPKVIPEPPAKSVASKGTTTTTVVSPLPALVSTTTLIPIEVAETLILPEPITTTSTTTTIAALPIVKAPFLRMIGKITDSDNITRYFFRNEKTGTVIKVRTDGIMEKSIRMDSMSSIAFFIEIEGILYECTKR